jgi:hypothetical protein
MKKIFSVCFLFLVFQAVGDDHCSLEVVSKEITSLSESLALPNCYNFRRVNLAQKGKLSPLCKSCKEDFMTRLPSDPSLKIRHDLKALKQQQFLEIALQEYKKNLTNNIIEVAKLRSLHNTGASFEKSARSCKFKDAQSFSACSPKIQSYLDKELKGVQGQLADELAMILAEAEPKNRLSGILNRSVTQSPGMCFIPEKDILLLANTQLEEELTPELLESLSRIDPSSNSDLHELISGMKEKELLQPLLSHPMFASFNNDPKGFVAFIQKLNPKTTASLQKEIYSKANGLRLDEKLAEDCQKSFESFSRAICSPNFEKGDFSFNPFEELEKLDDQVMEDAAEYAASEELIQKNLQAFQYCEMATSQGSLNANEALKEISQNLGTYYQNKPLKRFQQLKYQDDINKLNQELCQIASGKQPCTEGTSACKIFKRYQEMQAKTGLDAKLAGSSNKEVNDLLRSMIGEPSKLTPQTKTILIAQGILPDDQGSLVKQPQIAERQPEYFSQLKGAQVPMTSMVSRVMPVIQGAASARSYAPLTQPASLKGSEAAASASPEVSHTLLKDMQDISKVNQEIIRRLMDRPKESYTRADVKDAAKEVLQDKRNNNAFTSTELDRLADNFFHEVDQKVAQQPTSTKFREGTAKLDDKDHTKQRYKDQLNRALEDFGKGSREVAVSQAVNETSLKIQDSNGSNALSKVEIFTGPEKLERINLSEILKLKTQKDTEGKKLAHLIKNKESFILNVNQVSLMVQYNEKRKEFDILPIGTSEPRLTQKIIGDLKEFLNLKEGAPSSTSTTYSQLTRTLAPLTRP